MLALLLIFAPDLWFLSAEVSCAIKDTHIHICMYKKCIYYCSQSWYILSFHSPRILLVDPGSAEGRSSPAGTY